MSYAYIVGDYVRVNFTNAETDYYMLVDIIESTEVEYKGFSFKEQTLISFTEDQIEYALYTRREMRSRLREAVRVKPLFGPKI